MREKKRLADLKEESDGEEGLTIDEKALAKAEYLAQMIKEDPSISINQELVYANDLSMYENR